MNLPKRPTRRARRTARTLLALLCLCCIGAGESASVPARNTKTRNERAAGRKLALIVTVSELKYKVAPELRGPLNDARQIRRLLVDRYGFADSDIETVEKTNATKANIIAAFERLIARAKPGDLVVFYYSGHGTQVPDQPPLDEADGLDEVLVPYDANRNADGAPDPKTVFLDDELGALLQRMPTKNVVVLLDACHSGTGTRGGGVAKRWETVRRKPSTATVTVSDSLGGDLLSETVLTAASAEQTARDSELLRPVSEDGNPNVGAFTYALLESVNRKSGESLTYRQVYERTAGNLLRLGFQQTPQLEGSNLDMPFLSLPNSPAPVPIPPEPSAGGKTIAAIAQARVVSVSGPAVRLQRFGGGRFVKGSLFGAGNASVRVEQTSAGGLEADAALVAGGDTPLSPGQLLGQTAFLQSAEPLRVAVTGQSGAVQSITTLMRQMGNVRLIDASMERDIDLEARSENGQLTVVPVRKQFPLAPLKAQTANELAPLLRGAMDNLRALSSLLELENPNPAFTLELKVNGQDGAALRVGETVEFTLRASEDCYVYLVDVDPAGKVTVLFPNKLVPSNRLQANQTYAMPAPDVYRLRVQGPPGPEVLKAIATRKPLRLPTLATGPDDFTALTAPALQVSQALWKELRTVLGPVAGDTTGTLLPTEGWATDTAFLQVNAAK